jgi:hypothetical protein
MTKKSSCDPRKMYSVTGGRERNATAAPHTVLCVHREMRYRGSGFKVQDLGLRIQGLGLRAQGVGLRA